MSAHNGPEEEIGSSFDAADKLAAIEELFNQLESYQQSLVQDLERAKQGSAETSAKVQSLEAEIVQLRTERDAAIQGIEAALHNAADLQQQLSAQAEALRESQQGRDEQTAKAEAMEKELAELKNHQNDLGAGIQRLRRLAHSAAQSGLSVHQS